MKEGDDDDDEAGNSTETAYVTAKTSHSVTPSSSSHSVGVIYVSL